MQTLFVDVILPLPLPNLYTYRVPSSLNNFVKIGSRVVVQFGQKKILTAIIYQIHEKPPKLYEAKHLLSLLDENPLINTTQLKFFNWISNYYMCHFGEVLNASLPSGLKISSESRVQINPSFLIDGIELAESERCLISELLNRESMTYSEISVLLNIKSVYSVIQSLIKKNAIILFEEIKEKYRPKIVKRVKLSEKYLRDKSAFQLLLESLESKPKQVEIILKYISQNSVFQDINLNEYGLLKSQLLSENESDSAYKTLIKNNVLEEFEVILSRISDANKNDLAKKIELSSHQQKAFEEINQQLKTKDIVLFHGITGSGKTEIYIELIKYALQGDNQILYLLPEIALTTQIVSRLKKVFGNALGIYHSKYSDNERVEVWKGVQNGELKIIVGVRSSIFLPFDNLGLIIVDEEHESSFKQHEPAPRYNARDAAMVLAQLHHAKLILGSATPSIESYYNASQGKYGFVSLLSRYGDAQLPEIILVDSRKGKSNLIPKGEFSGELVHEINECIEKKEQVILFQNRRGYSAYVSCEDCGYVPQCKSCDVSLTHHLNSRMLTCHYCGHHEKIPSICPVCGSEKIKSVGFGTEKLEEESQLFFPNARVQRMDLDTTRSKLGFQRIIEAVENDEMDILVGTQMVTKGLDFEKVSLVGVFDIDRMIHFPDFRSYERVFQLLIQVSGRAGRRHSKGKVIIQTSQPEHIIFKYIQNNDYFTLFESEISDRQKYLYPPFCRIIKLSFKNEFQSLTSDAAMAFVKKIYPVLGTKRVLGPEPPVISRIRNQYIYDVYIKLEKEGIDINFVKNALKKSIQEITSQKEFKKIAVVIDVDPV
jgi:primosomal protein N' (replication factor Y)